MGAHPSILHGNQDSTPEDQKSYLTHDLDAISRRPFYTYRLSSLPTDPKKKRKIMDDFPKEPLLVSSYRVRLKIISKIEDAIKNMNVELASRLIQTLTKELCGKERNEGLFHIDDHCLSILTSLTNMLANDKGEFCFSVNFEIHANMLKKHLSPPEKVGHFPIHDTGNLTHLSLTGVQLYRKDEKYFKLLQILQSNPGLAVVDLSYTGLTTERTKDLLLYLTNRKELNRIGLQGNRLDSSIVLFLDRMLQRIEILPHLCWVDLRNNVDIIFYPQSLLESFILRQPQGDFAPLRNLAEGLTEDDNCDCRLCLTKTPTAVMSDILPERPSCIPRR